MEPGLEAKFTSRTALFILNILYTSTQYLHSLRIFSESARVQGSWETSMNKTDKQFNLVVHTF